MTPLRLGQRVVFSGANRSGVVVSEQGSIVIVQWDNGWTRYCFAGDLIPVEPVPGEGERGAG